MKMSDYPSIESFWTPSGPSHLPFHRFFVCCVIDLFVCLFTDLLTDRLIDWLIKLIGWLPSRCSVMP